MYIYQFIKYNCQTTLDHLRKNARTGAVLCFDFEDSIQNPVNPEENSSLKEYYRKCFKKIIHEVISPDTAFKLGLRINLGNREEMEKDIKAISFLKLHSIIVPKVESRAALKGLVERLEKAEVTYTELIPLIETKRGLTNLDDIVSDGFLKIKKIGFGHCDYNMDVGVFPFFHQDSSEYWKWVDRILSIITPREISFINSAYLKLNDNVFFASMLTHLSKICQKEFGQFTLSNKQSALCLEKDAQQKDFTQLIHNRLDLYVDEGEASSLREEFEKNNKIKGFSKAQNQDRIIAPQEYVMAKKYIKIKNRKKIHLTFVGGCFPVQHNILFEDHFHQLLKNDIEKKQNVEIGIKIIRYERFITCFEKIRAHYKYNPIDFLIFHIRPEPYLRLVKLYYKYLNYDGKIKHSLNLPVLNVVNPEKYDLLMLERRYVYNLHLKKSVLHKCLIDCNYRWGRLMGNQNYAIKKYSELVNQIYMYCQSNNIRLILLGPALRTNTPYEPRLCMKLDDYFKRFSATQKIIYMDGTNVLSASNEPLFADNGIYANEGYHRLIANKLFEILNSRITSR